MTPDTILLAGITSTSLLSESSTSSSVVLSEHYQYQCGSLCEQLQEVCFSGIGVVYLQSKGSLILYKSI